MSGSCSPLRKDACTTKEGCSWVVGKGCKSTTKKSPVKKSKKPQAIQKLDIKLAEDIDHLIAAIKRYNKLTLQKELNKKDIQAINELMNDEIDIDPRIQTKYVKKALEIIKKGPPAPPKELVNKFFERYEGPRKVTKEQVKAAMIATYKQRSLHNLTEDYPTIHMDVASALFDKWYTWEDTDPRESMFRVLSSGKF